MIKGISRQVIVVPAPEPKLFEQAIFILQDDADVTDEMLLKEAQKLLHAPAAGKKRRLRFYGPIWACGGAAVMALVWLISSLL